jgi:hypothetical protein
LMIFRCFLAPFLGRATGLVFLRLPEAAMVSSFV